MNVKQCPECKSYNTDKCFNPMHLRGNNTESWVAMYCIDCGYSYYIVYTPDRIEDRK